MAAMNDHDTAGGRGTRERKGYDDEDDNYDANDASNPSPPEERKGAGFLIMSAAQDNEFAEEQTDNNNVSHGAFTLALMTALIRIGSLGRIP